MSPEEAAEKWKADLADTTVFRTREFGQLKLAVRGHSMFVHETGLDRSAIRIENCAQEVLEFAMGTDADHFEGFAGVDAFASGQGSSEFDGQEHITGRAN